MKKQTCWSHLKRMKRKITTSAKQKKRETKERLETAFEEERKKYFKSND